jgi:hypothetical protein
LELDGSDCNRNKMDEYKEKLKYASIDAALIAAGFQIAIPEFFGIKMAD